MRAAQWSLPLLLIIASGASAQAKPEDAIRYRQSAYTVLLWNWMPMNAMVRGRIAFDAAEFARRADRVANLAPQLLEGFPPDSGTGAKTDAKAEIWTDFADFTSKMKDFEREALTLANVAKAGDEAAIKEQFGKTGASCKACHDQYKAE